MMLITTLVISFLVCCMLEVRCGYARVVSDLQAKAKLQHHSRELLMMGKVIPETC